MSFRRAPIRELETSLFHPETISDLIEEPGNLMPLCRVVHSTVTLSPRGSMSKRTTWCFVIILKSLARAEAIRLEGVGVMVVEETEFLQSRHVFLRHEFELRSVDRENVVFAMERIVVGIGAFLNILLENVESFDKIVHGLYLLIFKPFESF
uniref:Uncharacterized protein n=1 Tax=Rhizobium phage IG49 TaxID=3129228 RepID=A0AAU8HYE0_9CAUD